MGETKMRTPMKIIAVSAGWLALISGIGFAWAGQDNINGTSAAAVDLVQTKSGEEAGIYFVTGLDSQQNCTLIYASDDSTALAGSNEDWTYYLNDIWFLPPEKGKFGRVYFGPNFNGERVPQGGMNDQGLFYDGASAESVIKSPDSSVVPYDGDIHLKAMEECSTVDEVLKLYERYNMTVGDGQLLIGDRFGNSAIMEATGNIIRKKGDYQIATNFFQSRIEPENITDTRYRLAEKIFEQSENISVDLLRYILNATRWESYGGSMTATLYSYICDLKNGDIYIYHFHNFEDVVKINLREELEKGERYLSILSLFPSETYAAQCHKAQWAFHLLIERARDKGVDGDEGAIALYKAIRRGDFEIYQLSVGEGHLNALGYELLGNDQIEEAIVVFKYAVSEYPESANAYDSLAEAYMKNGDNELALENYQKSLELNPDNENAKRMLEQLQE
jgi:tetratricopeptide (TPR) repeat protein